MIKTKKILAMILCAMLVFSAFSACTGGGGAGGSSAANNAAPAPAPAPSTDGQPAASTTWEGLEKAAGLSGTVTYMHFGDDYERQMYADVFAKYMEHVPNVKVEQMFTPADYPVKLQTLAASNTLPDIYWAAETLVAEYAAAGHLTDLAPYLEQYPALHGDMLPGLKEYGEYNGTTYAITKDWTSYVMYINKEIFAEMGVDIPTSDWTMDDYREIAKKLTKREGDRVTHYGTAINNYRADWINFMGNYGAPWFKDGKSNVSDPDALKGLSVQYNLIQDGSAPSPGSVMASEGGTEDRLFIIGRLAMYPSGRWVVPSFREELDFEWTAVEMPKGSTRCTPLISGLVGISASSQNKDIAANLVSFQMSDEGMLYTMGSALSMPPYEHMMVDSNYVNTPPEPDAFVATSKYIGNEPQTEILKTGKWAQFNEIMKAELSLAFEGNQTIEQAVANIDKKANSEVFK